MRKGKYFELGYPSFSKGIEYSYPDEKIDYADLFEDKKSELEGILIDKLREYIPQFRVSTSVPSYPYSHLGMKGISLHIGNGGRWIEVWNMLGGYFIGGHNLDSYVDRAVCFNVGSDVVEYLDETMLAPRVIPENEEFVLRYPLPDGMLILSEEKILRYREDLVNIFDLMKLGGNLEFDLQEDYQQINTERGIVYTKDGFCEGREFKGFDVANASWAVAKLMSLARND